MWTRSRGVLRVLLGRYLEREPSGLRFIQGASGKPALLVDDPGPNASSVPLAADPASLHFNVSHSGEDALYAFSRTTPVGVDIEVAGRRINELAVARRVLGPVTTDRLARLDPAEREREFLRAWVGMEAKLKCRGTGIVGSLDEVEVTELWVVELEVRPRAAAAVAAERAPHELRCWSWSGVAR
jgi:4'-phosphopantetheinyl transferase